MQYQGVLKKMQTGLQDTVQYYLDFNNDVLNMNQLLNKSITISFEKYQCMSCAKDKQLYRQGFCKSCFYDAPQAGEWIMHPEKSTAHLGIEDRDLEFEKQAQLQPHIVYLALSSNIKVGVTRKKQVPTRWIDQGASKALPIVEVPNRYLAGIAEVALKNYVADKTNWRAMLKNEVPDEDLMAKKEELIGYLPEEIKEYTLAQEKEYVLNFPVEQYPVKLKSLNLTKTPEYTGVLKGIKGQYLIFEDQTVFNVRNNEGVVVSLSVN
ncbi:DUF2797 domain-containing protein [Pseudofulvibacter geojedonensis]|uniref:DUF2797 domain-containing protein n=1 Tax=Pseudofulvibacter geojedonensis TaxID=1123758 RepID=A0ABW3I674_9FLAO